MATTFTRTKDGLLLEDWKPIPPIAVGTACWVLLFIIWLFAASVPVRVAVDGEQTTIFENIILVDLPASEREEVKAEQRAHINIVPIGGQSTTVLSAIVVTVAEVAKDTERVFLHLEKESDLPLLLAPGFQIQQVTIVTDTISPWQWLWQT